MTAAATDPERPAPETEPGEQGSALGKVSQFLDLIRFSHTLFALPFALLAATMAWRLPYLQAGEGTPVANPFSWLHLAGILVCMTTARAAAMAFNRLVDRDIDAQNPRTQDRHLPAGTLSVGTVAFFAAVSSLGFVGGTLLFWPNWLPLALALPVLAFLLAYSYTKRFTSLAHFWLGMALLLAPVSAWIALRGTEVLADPRDLWPPSVLGLAVLLWVAGFDILYACQDAEFDRAAGLNSVPAALGVPGALRLAALCHLAMWLTLAAVPWVFPGLGLIYGTGWVLLGGLLVYEHSLVRADDLSQVNVAFFHVNAWVSIGLWAVTTIDLFW